MPIYEYTCEGCHKSFEQLVRSIHGAPDVKCPHCGSSKTERALSVFAVGAEGGKASAPPPGCGRCGGPGPCAMDE